VYVLRALTVAQIIQEHHHKDEGGGDNRRQIKYVISLLIARTSKSSKFLIFSTNFTRLICKKAFRLTLWGKIRLMHLNSYIFSETSQTSLFI